MTNPPLRWPNAACGLANFLLALCMQRSVVHATNSTPILDERPEIRLALVLDDWGSSTVAKYLLGHLNNSNRTLLPDFNVVIDTWRIEPASNEAPVAMVAMLSDDTPTYHAVVGPINRKDTFDFVPVVERARILNIHVSDSPGLSDRRRYPYTFRVTRSLKGAQTVIFHIVASNAWRSIISLWSEQDMYDASAEGTRARNITNYATFADQNTAAWAVETWQTDVVTFIRSLRIRVAIVHVGQSTGWQLICRVHRARLLGMQYFTQETWSSSWWMAEYDPVLGDCSRDEMYIAGGGYIVTLHTASAPGTNILGHPTPKLNGLDDSQIPLSCAPEVTPDSFFNDIGLLSQAVEDGFITLDDPGSAQVFISIAGLTIDALCASLLAIHDSIYTKGVTLKDIESRSPAVFKDLTDSMSDLEFRGAGGLFRFYNNTGDPTYNVHLIGQLAIAGVSNGSFHTTAVATFPDGTDGDPELSLMNESHPLTWRDGSTGLVPRPYLGEYPDCAETNGILVWDACEPCPPGTAFDPLLQACRVCPLGQFQESSGKDFCETAPPGFYIEDVSRPVAMTTCPEGYECPQAGTVSPQPCAPGRFAKTPGMATCELCPEGTYQQLQGAAVCKSCDEVLSDGVTARIASTSPSECICPAGTFRRVGQRHCDACLEGMVCPQGSDMRNLLGLNSSSAGGDDNASAFLEATPESGADATGPYPFVQSGFMTVATEPLTVYRCGTEGHCPGGPPGSCAAWRDPTTVACGDCLDGAYEAGEECRDCGKTGALPFIILCVAGLGMVVAATVLINADVHKVPASSMMVMAVSSLLVTSLQTMGVFSSMDIPWQEPVKTMLEFTELLSFDLDLVKIACVMGVNPLRSFAFRQLFGVLVIPFIGVTLMLKKYTPKWGKPRTDIWVELCNAAGTFYSIFFISIVLSAIDPYICYEHPAGQLESVRSAPSLLCFEGERHTSMIIIGMVSMCVVPVPFACLCAYGIAIYPRMIKMHSSSRFLHATRFLFLRYVPERYYFHLVALLRSFLLCLIPAVLRDKAATQVLFICVVLCIYVLAADNLQPWRSRLCNPLDSMMSMLLVVLLLCGALFLEDSPQKDAISTLSAAIIICILVCAFLAILYALWNRFRPNYFQYFVCHHKAGAAAQSRYLKTLILKRGKGPVFIDSDNLQELDTLFDTVKSRVRHLVVFLTADTLKRPWCVGEIVTALRAKITITRLQTPSFVALTEEQFAEPQGYIDTTGCNLQEYGIQWSDVTAAFRTFLSTAIPEQDLSQRHPGTQRFEHAVAKLLKQTVTDDVKVSTLSEIQAGSVLVVTHAENDEANAGAGILADRIAPEVYRCCEQGLSLLCDYDQNADLAVQAARQASVVVMMLSAGCLQSPVHLNIICMLMQQQGPQSVAPGFITVNIPGFDFPSPAMIGKLCRAQSSLEKAYTSAAAADSVVAFFKRISIQLPTHAAQHTIDTQSDEIARRIKASVKNKSTKLVTDSQSTTKILLDNCGTGAAVSPTGSLTEFSTIAGSQSASASAGFNPDQKILEQSEEDVLHDHYKCGAVGFTWTMDLEAF